MRKMRMYESEEESVTVDELKKQLGHGGIKSLGNMPSIRELHEEIENSRFGYLELSCGTLREDDLIDAFLPYVCRENKKDIINAIEYSSADVDLLIELIDILDSQSPEGYYFGSIEGDGSSFGYWEVVEEDW